MKTKKTVIFTGYSCNNNCSFCCHSDRRKAVKDRPIEELKKEIVFARKRGSDYLELVGGEPTIRKDVLEIISFAKQFGFQTVMFATNGRMFSNLAFAKKAIGAGLDQAVFSIHGDTPELHDSLTKVPGSFEQMKKGIFNLKLLGFEEIGSNTTIVKQNYESLPNIGRFIVSLGIKNSEFIFVDPTHGTPKTNFELTVPTYEEVSDSINQLLEFGRECGIPHWHVRYYPLCFLDEENLSMVSESHEAESFETVHIAPDFVNMDVLKTRKEFGRVKLKKCVGCIHQTVCEGYWSEYARRFNLS